MYMAADPRFRCRLIVVGVLIEVYHAINVVMPDCCCVFGIVVEDMCWLMFILFGIVVVCLCLSLLLLYLYSRIRCYSLHECNEWIDLEILSEYDLHQ